MSFSAKDLSSGNRKGGSCRAFFIPLCARNTHTDTLLQKFARTRAAVHVPWIEVSSIYWRGERGEAERRGG